MFVWFGLGFFILFLFRSEYVKPRLIELQYAIVLKLFFFYSLSSCQKISVLDV